MPGIRATEKGKAPGEEGRVMSVEGAPGAESRAKTKGNALGVESRATAVEVAHVADGGGGVAPILSLS